MCICSVRIPKFKNLDPFLRCPKIIKNTINLIKWWFSSQICNWIFFWCKKTDGDVRTLKFYNLDLFCNPKNSPKFNNFERSLLWPIIFRESLCFNCYLYLRWCILLVTGRIPLGRRKKNIVFDEAEKCCFLSSWSTKWSCSYE